MDSTDSDNEGSRGNAVIGVIGGSGFYDLLEEPRLETVSTPYGEPSAPVAVGTLAGRTVAFLPRHGKGHEFPPHLINYRANLWALRSLGVRQILAPCAVGGLSESTPRGALVVPDQIVDRTRSRAATFMDRGAVHAPFADPYCPTLRTVLLRSAPDAVDGGAMVVIEGPRFSTRAESQAYAAAGWSLVNMTGMPEAVLARELGVCYASLALVTDLDAGVDAAGSVDQAQVFAEFERNLGRVRAVVETTLTTLPEASDCGCADWLADVTLPFELP